MEASTVANPAQFSIYETKQIGNEHFLCVRKTDTAGSDWHIVSQNGLNYGAWRSIANFVAARKRALQPQSSDALVALPMDGVQITFRHIERPACPAAD